VEVALADLLPQKLSLSLEKIVEAVAAVGEISVDAILGPNRSQKNAEPRQVAMYLLRKHTNASLPQIGEALGGRDHSTVMYAIDKIEKKINDDDKKLKIMVNKIEDRLYSQVSVA